MGGKYPKEALAHAAKGGHLEAAKVLIEGGANIKFKWINDHTILHFACTSGNEALVKYLIDHGADVRATTKTDVTAFMDSTRSGNVDLVRYLMDTYGFAAHRVGKFGYTPLQSAAYTDCVAVVDFLVERGAKVNYLTLPSTRFEKSSDRPLTIAAREGNNNVVRALLDAGANINHQSEGVDSCVLCRT
jgi:ankyrin repeat protein